MRGFLRVSTLVLLGSCAGQDRTSPKRPHDARPTPLGEIPFSVEGSHLLVMDAELGGEDSRLVFDTGIGITLVDHNLCARLQCREAGSDVGKRMSGQEVELQLAVLPSWQAVEKPGAADREVVFAPCANSYAGFFGQMFVQVGG